MQCETFTLFNGTHNNTVVHFSFGEKNDYFYEAEKSDHKYLRTNVTVNRTDTNEQYFNLTMSQDINFLQVLSHLLYTYEEEGKPS